MATVKELFINALQVIQIQGQTNIPTVVFYDKSVVYFGSDALEKANDPTELNENFKLNLGESSRGRLDPPKFETGDGKQRSAHEITKAYLEGLLKGMKPWLNARNLSSANRVLVAEPLALDRASGESTEWLTNYRQKVRAILEPQFKEVDFLPEPFAVFQYYRYGVRHPLLVSNTKHAALVIDFGGGTFDVSVVETSAKGDVSASGRNSRPLAAASIPVGGSVINLFIARELLAKNVSSNVDKTKINSGWEEYKKGSVQNLRLDFKQFITNAKKLISQVEKAKIHICNSVSDWSLDAEYLPGPAMQILIPQNPFAEKPDFIPVKLDANLLKDIFIKKVWNNHLKQAITNAISRSKEELQGRPIDIVLLSGGSANIRWLSNLLRELIPQHYPNAELLELQGSFQEVVSKGLAIECARRTFNQGTSDFQSVTYNRLCLMLGTDGGTPVPITFKQIAEGNAKNLTTDGTLIESAQIIKGSEEKPLRWKFRLSSPPKHFLDFYFLKSSVNIEDLDGLYNIDHKIQTPRGTSFDSSIVLELQVSADGTARPKFIYKQASPDKPEISVTPEPFFLDMTYGENTTLGEAYVGIDFGTSNSSLSYVEQQAVAIYSERATDKGWCELNDLVSLLPYPISNPLVNFVGSANERDMKERFPMAFESALFFILTISMSDYQIQIDSKRTSIFKQFSKGSAGPIWSVLRSVLQKNPKKSIFIHKLQVLLEQRNVSAIDKAIEAINDHKHHRNSSYQGYREVLSMLGNTLNHALDGWHFGQFEEVTKKGFSSNYVGLFRAAHGAHSPFIDIFKYQGTDSFSNNEAVLVSSDLKQALRLSPFMFWVSSNSLGEQDIAILDSTDNESTEFRAIGSRNQISIGTKSNQDLIDLHELCRALTQSDSISDSTVFLSHCQNIQLTKCIF